MKEYTYRRTVFYQLHANHDWQDDHDNFDIKIRPDNSNVVEDAVSYLKTGEPHTHFPGAARAVAVAAAYLVAENFNENFYDVLNDKNLMHDNDPYFLPYSEDKETYDKIIEKVGNDINWDSFRMGLTKKLILEEYLLDEKGLDFMSREYSENECRVG